MRDLMKQFTKRERIRYTVSAIIPYLWLTCAAVTCFTIRDDPLMPAYVISFMIAYVLSLGDRVQTLLSIGFGYSTKRLLELEKRVEELERKLGETE